MPYTANRAYTDTNGNLHLNGSSLYIDESTAFSGTEAALTEGVTAGTWAASKACTLNSSGDATLVDGTDFVAGTSTGSMIGTAANQKLGWYGKTPIVQPASANQAALALDVDVTGGDTVDKTAVNANFSALQTLINQLRTDMVNLGLIKGEA